MTVRTGRIWTLEPGGLGFSLDLFGPTQHETQHNIDGCNWDICRLYRATGNPESCKGLGREF
jgi:hypothetical protein